MSEDYLHGAEEDTEIDEGVAVLLQRNCIGLSYSQGSGKVLPYHVSTEKNPIGNSYGVDWTTYVVPIKPHRKPHRQFLWGKLSYPLHRNCLAEARPLLLSTDLSLLGYIL